MGAFKDRNRQCSSARSAGAGIRGLIHQAALKANEDPDRLSFLHVVRVIRRKIASYSAIPPLGEEGLS